MGLHQQQELENAYVMHTYNRSPVEFVSGKGMQLTDSNGNTYLDFVSGIGAVSMGHAHPKVTDAITSQAEKLLHVSNLYYVEQRGELARDIDDLLGGGWKLFFANSGAEANEGAIKLARLWGSAHRAGAYSIITATNSFHGRTLATLTATGQLEKNAKFEPLPEGFSHVPLNEIAALEAAITEKTVAIMLECIQGEGGVYPCSEEYLRAVRETCDKHGLLLIVDEVQTGFFRTGVPFAFMHYGITPDIVTIAKGMGNGVPIGAVCARSEIATSFAPGDHGSTFGGSPLVCAASRATIDAMKAEKIGEHVATVGEYARTCFEQLPGVVEVRGKGLMLGIEFEQPCAADVVAKARERGVVLNNIGLHIIRILPPLICTNDEIDTLMSVFRALL